MKIQKKQNKKNKSVDFNSCHTAIFSRLWFGFL